MTKTGIRDISTKAVQPETIIEEPFIRKLDFPKMVLANYEPPKETVSVLEESDMPPPSIDYDMLPETSSNTRPTIVRGEIKKIIRVPKRKITIKP